MSATRIGLLIASEKLVTKHFDPFVKPWTCRQSETSVYFELHFHRYKMVKQVLIQGRKSK